jgi:DNA-directed RNA polymerase-3 subunit RPC5
VSFEDEENDPVIAEYDVYMTPELQEQIYLLQYPNGDRDETYSHTFDTPTGVRIKPKSGFMEIDLETNVHITFDKKKGVIWGEAVRQIKENGTDSFGIASGFGKGARTEHFGPDTTATRSESDTTQRLLRDFDRANDGGHVLNKQILGGSISRTGKGRNILMLGTFRGRTYSSPVSLLGCSC